MLDYFNRLKWIIPKSIRSKIITETLKNKIHARSLAGTSKRLDLCAAQMALFFHLSGIHSIKGKTCLEIGSGWVLTHAIVCYLLGAKKIIATDIEPLFYPAALYQAIHQAVPSIVREVLSPFCEFSEVRERLNRLLSIRSFNVNTLKDIVIEYIAPIDLAQQKINETVDLIYSISALQLVPMNNISPLLNSMVDILASGGTMMHAIHLEDNYSCVNNPFAFYSELCNYYTEDIISQRGNRLRRSSWYKLFSQLPQIYFRFYYEWSRIDKPLPKVIDSSIRYDDESDLRVSHIGVLATKR
jgi:hypothetical protein